MDPTLLQILQSFANASIELQRLREAHEELEAKNEQLAARVAELEAASEPTPISKAQEA
jgi:hypothetical protein